jgi:ribonuclease HI
MQHVYTDGACSANKRASAHSSAGVGVYFGAAHPLNYSAPLRAPPHTNQRAELEAILVALERIDADPRLRSAPITLWSDSQYSIDCLTKWCSAWERNGWVTSGYRGAAKPVLNQDLIRPSLALLRRLRVELRKVPGHAGIEGNECADALARAGVAAPRSAPAPAPAPSKAADRLFVLEI